MAKVVIAASVSLENHLDKWIRFWEKKNYQVIDYPKRISKDNFKLNYPKVYSEFFSNLLKADLLFVMNEEKNGISGYIGAEVFAEICFTVANNLLGKKNVRICLLRMPSGEVQSFEELKLWLDLGWIELMESDKFLASGLAD